MSGFCVSDAVDMLGIGGVDNDQHVTTRVKYGVCASSVLEAMVAVYVKVGGFVDCQMRCFRFGCICYTYSGTEKKCVVYTQMGISDK